MAEENGFELLGIYPGFLNVSWGYGLTQREEDPINEKIPVEKYAFLYKRDREMFINPRFSNHVYYSGNSVFGECVELKEQFKGGNVSALLEQCTDRKFMKISNRDFVNYLRTY